MTPHQKFESECVREIEQMADDADLRNAARNFMNAANVRKYSYHFGWLGRPIIQFPQDIVAFQEIVWKVKPDIIIETGIAHGGSLILSASLLAMLDLCDAATSGQPLDPKQSRRGVMGIDIDIRSHNREAIEAHPFSPYITLVEGSSLDSEVAVRAQNFAKDRERVLVVLDSNHTHDHVLKELQLYAHLVTPGSYCIVFDTIVEDMPEDSFPDRSWGKGDNPKTAVWEFLQDDDRFEIDHTIPHKLQVTVAPDGFLRRKS